MIALARGRGRRLRGAALLGAVAPAVRLLTATGPTLVAGTIPLVSPPLRPPACPLPTGCAAISSEGVAGLKGLFAALQQAKTPSATDCGLPGTRTGIFWNWAQGRYSSQRSSLGAKRQLRTEAFYCATGCQRCSPAATLPLYCRQDEQTTPCSKPGTDFVAGRPSQPRYVIAAKLVRMFVATDRTKAYCGRRFAAPSARQRKNMERVRAFYPSHVSRREQPIAA